MDWRGLPGRNPVLDRRRLDPQFRRPWIVTLHKGRLWTVQHKDASHEYVDYTSTVTIIIKPMIA
jgi:hypothetical protein